LLTPSELCLMHLYPIEGAVRRVPKALDAPLDLVVHHEIDASSFEVQWLFLDTQRTLDRWSRLHAQISLGLMPEVPAACFALQVRAEQSPKPPSDATSRSKRNPRL
jgi:hypothetical protein